MLERYRIGADEHSLFMSMSVTKSVISTLVGLAIGDGLIGSVEDPISDYLTELKGSGYNGQASGPQVQPDMIDAYNFGYQYHWWMRPCVDGAFMAKGVSGQFLYVNPAVQLVIVVASAWFYWVSADLEYHTHAVFDAFTEALGG